MKRLLPLLAACHAELDPPWQLDHDRIVAARATPPAIAAGEVAQLDALVAHAGAPTDVEAPIGATAANAPGGLFTAVHFLFDHWEVEAPDDAALAAARAELGLAADAPVPLDVTLVFPHGLVATKTVLLGVSRANPALPAITIGGAAPGATLAVPRDRDVLLGAAATNVRWLSSCGTLDDADEPQAVLHVYPDDRPQGEFSVVVRDGTGVVWQVWAIAVD